jgi:hypothetical protein
MKKRTASIDSIRMTCRVTRIKDGSKRCQEYILKKIGNKEGIAMCRKKAAWNFHYGYPGGGIPDDDVKLCQQCKKFRD